MNSHSKCTPLTCCCSSPPPPTSAIAAVFGCRHRLRESVWKRASGAAAENGPLFRFPTLQSASLSPAHGNPARCLDRAISRAHCVASDLALSMAAEKRTRLQQCCGRCRT